MTEKMMLTDTKTVFSQRLIGKVVRVEGITEDGNHINKIGMVHEVELFELHLRLISGDILVLGIDDFLELNEDRGFMLYVFTEEREWSV